GERGRRRLVDDPQDLEARDLPGLLRRLALRVVEVRRNGDDRLRDRVAEERLGVSLQLEQDLGADLLRGPTFAVDIDGPAFVAHVALYRTDRAIGVGDGLPFGDLTDQDLPVLREPDHGRRRSGPLRVRDDDRFPGLQYRHDRV